MRLMTWRALAFRPYIARLNTGCQLIHHALESAMRWMACRDMYAGLYIARLVKGCQ